MDGLRTDNYPDGFSERAFEEYWGDCDDDCLDDDDDYDEDDDDDAEWE